MNIKEQIQADIYASMKAGNKSATVTLRTLLGAIQNAESSGKEKIVFTDHQVVTLLAKEKKKRLETAKEYETAGIIEKAAHESAEAELITRYLPEMMTSDEMIKAVNDVIAEFEAPTIRVMGLVMKRLAEVTEGRADTKALSDLVKEKLSAVQEV